MGSTRLYDNTQENQPARAARQHTNKGGGLVMHAHHKPSYLGWNRGSTGSRSTWTAVWGQRLPGKVSEPLPWNKTETGDRLEQQQPVVKSTYCSRPGPELGSQHPYSSSAIPNSSPRASGLHGHQACMQCMYIYAGKTILHMKYN